MKVEDFLKQQKPYQVKESRYPIRKIKVSEDYVMVFLEEEKIMVSIETYFQYGLKDLKGLDEELYEILKQDEKLTKAYRSCLRKLSARDHTEKQIRDHLHSLELFGQDRDDIIERLKEYGLLDDEKYCISRISWYNRNNLSVKQISQKLSRDGVSEDLITKYVTVDSEEERKKATAIAEKYAGSIKNRPLAARKRMLLNKLMNSGFSYEIAKNIAEGLETAADEDLKLLEKEYRKAQRKYERKYADRDLKQHISAALYAKGFRLEDIRKVMEE